MSKNNKKLPKMKIDNRRDLDKNSINNVYRFNQKEIDILLDRFSFNSLINPISYELNEDGNIIKLNLISNNIKELPPEIGQLTNLKSLDLSNNVLKELPPEIGQLKNLQNLDLFNN